MTQEKVFRCTSATGDRKLPDAILLLMSAKLFPLLLIHAHFSHESLPVFAQRMHSPVWSSLISHCFWKVVSVLPLLKLSVALQIRYFGKKLHLWMCFTRCVFFSKQMLRQYSWKESIGLVGFIWEFWQLAAFVSVVKCKRVIFLKKTPLRFSLLLCYVLVTNNKTILPV